MATPTSHAQRVALASLMDYLVQHRGNVHYAQRRPMETRKLASVVALKRAVASAAGVTMDCSESVTLLCRLAGLDDPNDQHYNGLGYTGTLLDHLPHYDDPGNADIGALAVFGPGTGQHVCMVREPGRNPLLFSHGEEAGPFYLRLNVERTYHSAPVRFLSIANL